MSTLNSFSSSYTRVKRNNPLNATTHLTYTTLTTYFSVLRTEVPEDQSPFVRSLLSCSNRGTMTDTSQSCPVRKTRPASRRVPWTTSLPTGFLTSSTLDRGYPSRTSRPSLVVGGGGRCSKRTCLGRYPHPPLPLSLLAPLLLLPGTSVSQGNPRVVTVVLHVLFNKSGVPDPTSSHVVNHPPNHDR